MPTNTLMHTHTHTHTHKLCVAFPLNDEDKSDLGIIIAALILAVSTLPDLRDFIGLAIHIQNELEPNPHR